MRRLAISLLLAAAPVAAVAQTQSPQGQPQRGSMTNAQLPPAPRAEQRPHSFERHGVRVEDPYHWLRDQGYPTVDDEDVLSYLRAENAYFEAAMALAPEVRECHNITGTIEYLLRVETEDLASYKHFHTEVLGVLPQVLEVIG